MPTVDGRRPTVHRVPVAAHVLDGAKEIADALGLHNPRRVYSYVQAGAPVRVMYAGRGRDPRARRYLAELEALLAWVRCEKKLASRVGGRARALT